MNKTKISQFTMFLILLLDAKWRVHRKLIAPTFNSRILESFVEIFSAKSEAMVKKMEVELNKEEFNIFHYVSLCTLDIICGENTKPYDPLNMQ